MLIINYNIYILLFIIYLIYKQVFLLNKILKKSNFDIKNKLFEL